VSKRESIAGNIVTVLDAMSSPELKKITREPFEVNDLSDAQFPAVWISTGDETRSDITIGGSSITRQGAIDYVLVGYVKGSSIDTARNALIEGIEEALDDDRTRGGYSKDTETTLIEVDNGDMFPVGAIRVTVSVTYEYTTGST